MCLGNNIFQGMYADFGDPTVGFLVVVLNFKIMAICTEYLNASSLYHINLRGIEGASLLTLFLGKGSECSEVCGQHGGSLEKSPSSHCQLNSLKGEEQQQFSSSEYDEQFLEPLHVLLKMPFIGRISRS